jgi:hypothetical protein
MADETGGGSGEAANDNQPQAANDNQPDAGADEGEPNEADSEGGDGSGGDDSGDAANDNQPQAANDNQPGQDDEGEPPEDDIEDDGEPPEDDIEDDDGEPPEDEDPEDDDGDAANDNQPQAANDNQLGQGDEGESADSSGDEIEDDDGEEDDAPGTSPPDAASIRSQYLDRVASMRTTEQAMRAADSSEQEIANALVNLRNEAKVAARALMNPDDVTKLEARNLAKYGNPVGPNADWLYDRYGSWEEVINAAYRTDPAINKLLGGGD